MRDVQLTLNARKLTQHEEPAPQARSNMHHTIVRCMCMASCRRPSARTAAPEEHNSSIEHGETSTIRATRVRATHGSTAAPLVVRRPRRRPLITASRPHSRGARLECWQKFWHVGGRASSARPRQWADRGRRVDLHTGDLCAAAARLGTSDRPHRAAGERPEARASSMYHFARCECTPGAVHPPASAPEADVRSEAEGVDCVEAPQPGPREAARAAMACMDSSAHGVAAAGKRPAGAALRA